MLRHRALPAGRVATALSVLGADIATGESGLKYTWAATTLPSGATAPTFSANGTNAAKNTTATLSKAGIYGFTATITDSGSLSVTSSVSVPVAQALTTIVVSPVTVTVNPGATQQFTAESCDQFGSALATQPTLAWTTTVGTITAGGLFTAQNTPGRGMVMAGSGTIHGTSSVTVTNQGPTVAKPASATPKPATGGARRGVLLRQKILRQPELRRRLVPRRKPKINRQGSNSRKAPKK